MQIEGEFEVTLQPIEGHVEGRHDVHLTRLSIDKVFHGPLRATSRGEMLSVRTPVEGSAGYVAIEQVSGDLEGRQGSFVLQHFGIMHAGNYRLILEVVPDSGTDQLASLRGTMKIDLSDGQHRYDFEYEVER